MKNSRRIGAIVAMATTAVGMASLAASAPASAAQRGPQPVSGWLRPVQAHTSNWVDIYWRTDRTVCDVEVRVAGQWVDVDYAGHQRFASFNRGNMLRAGRTDYTSVQVNPDFDRPGTATLRAVISYDSCGFHARTQSSSFALTLPVLRNDNWPGHGGPGHGGPGNGGPGNGGPGNGGPGNGGPGNGGPGNGGPGNGGPGNGGPGNGGPGNGGPGNGGPGNGGPGNGGPGTNPGGPHHGQPPTSSPSPTTSPATNPSPTTSPTGSPTGSPTASPTASPTGNDHGHGNGNGNGNGNGPGNGNGNGNGGHGHGNGDGGQGQPTSPVRRS